jgi:hypothetical protein
MNGTALISGSALSNPGASWHVLAMGGASESPMKSVSLRGGRTRLWLGRGRSSPPCQATAGHQLAGWGMRACLVRPLARNGKGSASGTGRERGEAQGLSLT